MDFNMSDRQREWLDRVQSFMHSMSGPRCRSTSRQMPRASAGKPSRSWKN